MKRRQLEGVVVVVDVDVANERESFVFSLQMKNVLRVLAYEGYLSWILLS